MSKTENKKTILFVEDDSSLMQSVNIFLKKRGYDVTLCLNGERGLEAFNEKKPDIIVSDIKMPKMDGITFLEKVREQDKDIKFVFVTAFSELLEVKDAYERGANGFLTKPFKLDELIFTIENLLNEVSIDKDNTISTIYHPIPIEEFVSGSKIQFAVFIRLSELKYVKLGNSGEDIAASRIEKYKSKGISELFLAEEDYQKYLSMTKKIVNAMKGKSVQIDDKKRREFMKGANKIIMENLLTTEIDKKSLNEASEVINSTFDVVTKENDMFKLLNDISDNPNNIYSHSLCVSMFATMLAKKLDFITENDLSLISMGAVFHDSGKRMISKKLIDKKLMDLTPEEKKELEKHPIYGAEILAEIPNIPEEVVKITLEHHENIQGTGYPNSISGESMHRLSKIVAIADDFTFSVSQVQNYLNEKDRYQKALARMINIKAHLYEPDYLKKFVELFSFKNELTDDDDY